MDVIIISDSPINESAIGNSRYLGAYVIASKLRTMGIEVKVIDYASQSNDLIENIVNLANEDTAYIGFSSTFMTPTKAKEHGEDLGYYSGVLWFHSTNEAANWLKDLTLKLAAKNSKPKLVVGGAKALYLMLKKDTQNLFDYFVIGISENSAIELFFHLKNKTDLNVRQYQNAFYIGESAVKEQKTPLESTMWSIGDGVQNKEALGIELSRGCLYNCKFCHFDKQFSLRKDFKILRDEFVRNFELFGTQFYHFSDDCFNDRREKVETFCELFLKLPFSIEWSSYARVDIACKYPETLDLMVESGARSLFWGIETLNSAVARKAGKGTPSDHVKEMFVRSREKHFDHLLNHGSFIVGLPGECEESFAESVDWVIQSRALDFVSFFPLNLRPYSSRLDKVIIDYGDYSRRPDKYGFRKIEFHPRSYWEHDEMNLPRAIELASESLKMVKSHGISDSFVTSAFQYPHLRGLGFTQKQIFDFTRNCKWGSPEHSLCKQVHLKKTSKYLNSFNKEFIKSESHNPNELISKLI